MIAAAKATLDREAIEREFRAGQLSVSEIGRIYGVTHTAILKKAKKLGIPVWRFDKPSPATIDGAA